MATYIAVIRKTPDTDYWVDIPDIPGCVSRGATAEAAKRNFREALALHLKGDAALPPPRTRQQLRADELEDSVDTFEIEI